MQFNISIPQVFINNPLYNSTLKGLIPILRCLGPGFCAQGSALTCHNVTFSNCSTCSLVGAGFFIAIAIIILIIICFGNTAIMVSILRGGEEMRNNMNYIRFSMCISDLTVGVVIGAALLPNILTSLYMTPVDHAVITASSKGALKSIVFGFLFSFGYTSSMYHLLLLSSYRFVAITWPLWYRVHGNRHLWISFLIVWTVSLLSACLPGLIGENIVYTYHQANFLYLPTLRFDRLSSIAIKAHSLAAVIISTFFIPYILVTIVLVVTVVQVRRQLRESNNALHQNDKKHLKREVAIIKTIVMMFASFSITICPLTVCFFFVYGPLSNCYNISTASMVCTLLAMSNSAVNVILYGVREKQFRRALKTGFKRLGVKSEVSSF